MLDDRKKAFEVKFVTDEEIEFKAKAMASKLFGSWATEVMKMDSSQTDEYIKNLIDLSIRNKDYAKVIHYVQNNLKDFGKNYNENDLKNIYLEKLELARDKLEN